MRKYQHQCEEFSRRDWLISDLNRNVSTQRERSTAERRSNEIIHVIEESEKTSVRAQQSLEKEINQRLLAIKFWQNEVVHQMIVFKAEIDDLNACLARICGAIDEVREPIHIVKTCLNYRQQRAGIDLVCDEVTRELLKEEEVYEGALALLQRTKEHAVEQIRLARKTKYWLDKDLRDKYAASMIDERNIELKHYSIDLQSKPRTDKCSSNRMLTADEWEVFSRASIDESEKQRRKCASMRSITEEVLQRTVNDLESQKRITDSAFIHRIQETRSAKDKLENQLLKVREQITEMEDNIDLLARAITEKRTSLQLAQVRLDNRTLRPDVECCRDNVHCHLVNEISRIHRCLEKLFCVLERAKESLKGLIDTKVGLEGDIEVKLGTLLIDEAKCMGMRQSIKFHKH